MRQRSSQEKHDQTAMAQGVVARLEHCRTGTPATIPEKRRRRSFNHQCYRTALEFVIEHGHIPEIRLVHGELGFTGAVPHAWVELPQDVIFDGTLQRYYRKSCYYSSLAAFTLKSYSVEAALALWTSSGNYGTWV
jgi:hypothetical protein